MGRPPRNWTPEPRRVESPARMTVAEVAPVVTIVPMPLVEVATMDISDVPQDIALVNAATSYPTEPYVNREPDGVRHHDMPMAVGETCPWHPMPTALCDGTLLEGRTADGVEFMMVWRKTSRHDGRRWVATGFWSSHLSREPLKMEPVSWRRWTGAVMPGMIAS